MEWWGFLLAFFGLLLFFMFLGMPVVFSFLVVNFLAAAYVIGFESGMNQLVLSIYDSLAKFTLTPIPLFVLMGELLFYSGLVVKTLDVLSKWLGKIPGRLAILSVGSGTLFAALSGSSIANTSMLGSVLVPDMRARGYHVKMTVGPLMASGSLAMIIPPSAVAVLLGSIGQISVGKLLIAGIVPGFLMATLFVFYIMFACWRNPSLAPAYEVETVSWGERIRSLVVNVLPMGIIILLVVGLIFLGVATPTEAAAVGALGSLILVAAYGRLSWTVLKKSLLGTMRISGMILLIIAGSAGFSQLLAFTGASRALVNMILGFDVAPIMIIILMLLIVVILGMFIEAISIMMITLPLFMPMVHALDFDPVWFGIMMLICLDLGNLTPPFGLLLFVMKGVAPKDVTMVDIYKSATPFISLEALTVILIMLIPPLALWLPSIGG